MAPPSLFGVTRPVAAAAASASASASASLGRLSASHRSVSLLSSIEEKILGGMGSVGTQAADPAVVPSKLSLSSSAAAVAATAAAGPRSAIASRGGYYPHVSSRRYRRGGNTAIVSSSSSSPFSTVAMPTRGSGDGGSSGSGGGGGGPASRVVPASRRNHAGNALADDDRLLLGGSGGRAGTAAAARAAAIRSTKGVGVDVGDILSSSLLPEAASAAATGTDPVPGVRLRRLSEVPIAEVLKAKHTLRWVEPVINKDATVQEAISVCIERGLSGMMVVDRSETITDDSRLRGRVVGMTTSRDLLRVMAAGFKEGKTADELMTVRIGQFMTPISQVIYTRPEETIGMCRTVMAKLGVKCLPVLSNGRVEGLVTARDMSEFGLEATERGGKKNYLRHVSQRVGLGSNTSMAEPPSYLRAHLALESRPLFVNIGVGELPHPYKTHSGGVGMNARDYGPNDYSRDPDLSEDAHFVCRVEVPDETGPDLRFVTYMGVADGVGSWREYGVDPRDFSRRLMWHCEQVLVELAAESRDKFLTDDKHRRFVMPREVLDRAYHRVKAENVIGSSTACVGLFDCKAHQLHFANLGDSGIVVLRHIDADGTGALLRSGLKKSSSSSSSSTMTTTLIGGDSASGGGGGGGGSDGDRKTDLRIAFVSQQQLRSFNHPYQLGWTGEELDQESEGHSFKTAQESCMTSIHVRRGDIILMATDGLFDNVDIDDIARIAMEWEQDNGFVRGGDVVARDLRWSMGNSMSALSAEAIPDLAATLCEKARELSLDSSVDSPFAILAKENDIMWSGGMPDDCTVLAMHVVGKSADDTVGQIPAS